LTVTLDTIGALIDNGYNLRAYCNAPQCHHCVKLDLEALAATLGRDHSSMHKDLVPKLYWYRNNDDWFLSGDLTDQDNVKAIIAQCQRDLLEHNFSPEHQLFISTIIETLDGQQGMFTALERERASGFPHEF
jgi:hypothetical protein